MEARLWFEDENEGGVVGVGDRDRRKGGMLPTEVVLGHSFTVDPAPGLSRPFSVWDGAAEQAS